MIFNEHFSISASPSIGLNRRVSVFDFKWRPQLDFFEIIFIVEYLDISNNVISSEGVRPYNVSVIANTDIKVDSNGDILPMPLETDIDYETKIIEYNAAITQYEFFLNLMQSELTLVQRLQSVVNKADSNNRFD